MKYHWTSLSFFRKLCQDKLSMLALGVATARVTACCFLRPVFMCSNTIYYSNLQKWLFPYGSIALLPNIMAPTYLPMDASHPVIYYGLFNTGIALKLNCSSWGNSRQLKESMELITKPQVDHLYRSNTNQEFHCQLPVWVLVNVFPVQLLPNPRFVGKWKCRNNMSVWLFV